MNYFKRIYIKYERDGIWRVTSILLKKLGIHTTYSSFIHKKKVNLYKKISEITKHKVINGYYKSLILSKNYNWNKDDIDLSPKLLGCYEEQVQEKIIELKKKNNLKYLVVFGASEGFHALGLMKNKFFSKAYIFENDDKTRNILIKNSKINKIKKIFFKLIYKYFNVSYLNNGNRNPHRFKDLYFLNDDEKYLIMSENRPCTMHWLILSPKYT